MTEAIIRVLHLSDFHMGKDHPGQRMLFKNLLAQVSRQEAPHLVVITGDLAMSGKAGEYRQFIAELLIPLRKQLPQVPFYLVPGNHDVDRSKARLAFDGVRQNNYAQFFDPDEKGQELREGLHGRFQAYVDGLSGFTHRLGFGRNRYPWGNHPVARHTTGCDTS